MDRFRSSWALASHDAAMINDNQAMALEMAAAVVRAEHDRQAGIDRTDTALEVLDTARFARAALSWVHRISPHEPCEFTFDHPHTEHLVVNALHACPNVITGRWDSTFESHVAMNPAFIQTARGLGTRHCESHSAHGCLTSWLVTAWDGGWVMAALTGDGRAHIGQLCGVNVDAFDLLIEGLCVTFPWPAVVLIRQYSLHHDN